MSQGVTVQMLTWYQLIALKNLYDQEIWPLRIGIVHETGDVIIEYDHSVVSPNGIRISKETIKIPKEHKS